MTFLGNASSAAACAALVDTAAFAGWAWVSDADGEWSLGCYGRVDDGTGGFGPACFPEARAPPCSVALEPAVTSAVRFALAFNTSTWAREFEFLSVAYFPVNASAVITPRAR